MVGIVIVSHSEKLAAGVQELALQMAQGKVRCAVAAGIDDPENPFGTDAMQIYQAIESVYTDEGVVVLMDLGSAILSAEMALEFLQDDQRDQVRLCEAPLVEGTIAAVVQAANGADIEEVLAEARGALAAKVAQLSGLRTQDSGLSTQHSGLRTQHSALRTQHSALRTQDSALRTQDSALSTQHSALSTQHSGVEVGQLSKELYLTVRNPMGLHARPAAKFVATASRFESRVTVQNVTTASESVNAKSINQVITLGVRQGHEIAIAATGTDATEALTALQHLVEANFGEASVETLPQTHRPAIPTADNAHLTGIPASPGIAIGPVVLYQPDVEDVTEHVMDNPQESWEQLQHAIHTACHQLQTLRHQVSTQLGEEEAAIFDAHLLCLSDPAILEAARQRIFDYALDAASAWKVVVARTVLSYEALKDPYLKERAADVRDVGQRVLRILTGVTASPLDLQQPAILVTPDLTPSQTAQLDRSKVLGICTAAGGATSHSGILARSLGIPAVVGVDAHLLGLENGTLIALNGETGQVWVQPDEMQLAQLQTKRDQFLAAQQEQHAAVGQPAITQDGRQIKVMANIGGVADARFAVENGAEGVGLLRSEFLYFDRENWPTEEEQVERYEAIAKILSPHPLIIRTLDIGGDKPLPYLNLAAEPNPFLGWRGIRFLLDSPDILTTQLRAILRTSHQYPIKMMFPMITCLKEIHAAKAILGTVKTQLRQEGIPFNESMEVGMMVEVPAAVVMADRLATEVDFFSIGTNDLTQFVMASDRTNPKVAILADAFEPAVLRMIQQTVNAARHAGIWVGVCGELASCPLAASILVGLGVDELSMNPPAIGGVKAAVSQLRMEEAHAIAQAVLKLDSAQAVREYIAQKAGESGV